MYLPESDISSCKLPSPPPSSNRVKYVLYLLSRTWRFTEADSNWAGRQVYLPESDISACKIVNVLTVVPAAMCSGGVVCSLAPLWLPILKLVIFIRPKYGNQCLLFVWYGVWPLLVDLTQQSGVWNYIPEGGGCKRQMLIIMTPFYVGWGHKALWNHATQLNRGRGFYENVSVSVNFHIRDCKLKRNNPINTGRDNSWYIRGLMKTSWTVNWK